jgi:hypothetical protein
MRNTLVFLVMFGMLGSMAAADAMAQYCPRLEGTYICSDSVGNTRLAAILRDVSSHYDRFGFQGPWDFDFEVTADGVAKNIQGAETVTKCSNGVLTITFHVLGQVIPNDFTPVGADRFRVTNDQGMLIWDCKR